MADTAETLIDLLNGDFVRLATPDLAVKAEVVDHSRDRRDADRGGGFRYTIRFMPVGESATDVSADRFRVSVESDGHGGWAVGPLVAEVFVESEVTYEREPRGDLVAVELLHGP